MEWVGPARIPPMSTWARRFPEARDTGGSDVLPTHSRYRCQGPGSGDPGSLNNLWTCVHLLLLSLISMLVCISRCVCGCGRALGFRHHQACWPGGGPHQKRVITHTFGSSFPNSPRSALLTVTTEVFTSVSFSFFFGKLPQLLRFLD